jgi:DNA polymerase-1
VSALKAREGTGRPAHVFLVDGSGFIFRAYHALPPMNRRDGTPTNAVFGFCNMLMKLLEDTDADYVAVIFDAARRNFRNDIYPDYKANRPDAPEDLVPQFELIREATRAFNVPCLEMEGYEADDLIATYAREAEAEGAEVTIVSSDKDLMQLVTDGIYMMDPMRNRRIGTDEVREKFGVGPDKVVDVQALAGDSTDNVPGVPGIGVKTAAELINSLGDLDTVLAKASEIKQPKRRENLIAFADQARISRDLVRLKDDVPVTEPLSSFGVRAPDPQTLVDFLRAQDFTRLLARIESKLAAEGVTVEGVIGAAEAAELAPEEKAYEPVQEVGALKEWIARAHAAGTVAVDTETTSLDAMRADLVGVSLSVSAAKACYIPLGHRQAPAQGDLDLGDGGQDKEAKGANGKGAPKQVAFDQAIALLKPLFEDASVLKVGHNIKYDAQVLARYGIAVAPVDDTMVLSYVLEGGMHRHGLDELASLHLGHETIKYADVAGSGRKQVSFEYVPLAAAVDYAAEDADITGRLHRLLKPRLAADRMVTVYETLERPLIAVLTAMERAGIKVDRAELEALSKDFATRLVALANEIHELAGRQFNIGSPKQLGEVLFEDLGLPGGKVGKTGAYGTGAGILENLAAQGHDLPVRVLAWRQIAKLKSTYSDALTQQINPETGRVHTSYAMAGASTGRLASTDPNLQNIPVRTEEGRKIRRAFIADGGFKLISADYSQVELRLLAHVAGIDALKECFAAGEDIHAMTAAQVFGVPADGMDPSVRRQAKAINFGIIYGISPFGLANQLGISQGEAADYIDAYFERYPGIRGYMEETKETCRANGYVETIFGRKIHITGINDKNGRTRGFAERAAINAPLQGAAADIIKRAMIRMPGALKDAGLKARMLLQVHDELVFEAPEGEVADTVKVVTMVMENAADPAVRLDVPLVVETGAGDNWAEVH